MKDLDQFTKGDTKPVNKHYTGIVLILKSEEEYLELQPLINSYDHNLIKVLLYAEALP
jgi:hypothetical protein